MRKHRVRIVSFLLAALVITSMISTVPVLTGAVGSLVGGDVNGDGRLSSADVRDTVLYLIGSHVFDKQQIRLADVNGDGTVNTTDARTALQAILSGDPLTPPTLLAEETDLLVYDRILSTENATVTEQADGSWVISATAPGKVTIEGPGIYDAAVLQWTHVSVSSTTPFVITFYDETNDRKMDTSGDFSDVFGDPAPAGEYGNKALWTNGCYTWDKSPLPETVDMQTITIELQAAGTMILGHMMLSDRNECEVAAPSLAMLNFDKKANLTYTFTGDEQDKAGFAQGTITVTPTTSNKTSGYYLVYYANTYGLLEEYDEVASIAITGGTVSHTVKDGAYLPPEATKLAVFESDSRFLDAHPNVETAVDILDLNPAKHLDLGDLQYRFGATSDIHINFEGLGFGSEAKWKNTLNFFSEHEVDSVIITGDMTGDTNLDYEYGYYIDSIKASGIPVENVYEAIGNHGNTASTIGLFTAYTSGTDEVHPFENSPYYYVVKEGKNEGDRDNVFIFMAQELAGPSDSAIYDNFSKAQIDWLEETLATFNKPDTNVFLIEHAPFWNWSPGDRYNGDYTRKITFKESYTQTMRLKGLLETYKNVIMMSGHTHLTFYENENYSDQYDTFCRMVHVSSGTQTSSYNHGDKLISDTDGRYSNSTTYGSEGYIVDLYEDYIVYTGYNISTGHIIPAGCILIPTTPYGGSGGNVIDPTIKDVTGAKNLFDVVAGQGTQEDPYRIETAEHFKLLTDEFAKSTATDQAAMFGYGMYFKQTADIDMTGVEGYNGTAAGGGARYAFAGNYNGDGHTLKVDIDGGDQQSVFPYSYGVIANLRVEGRIAGGVCAQVVRALYGQLINCVFEVDLDAEQEGGAIYSNYSYVYNLYVAGTHSSGAAASPVAVNHNSTDYHNVYHYRTQNGAAVSSPYGTQSNDLTAVAASLNSHNDGQYATALSYLGGYAMCELTVKNGQLDFVSG
ncbi:MAG: metallophosphoesterase [Clostridia bacterium]|nr:metallophosphoesterase [Clostridia bacterium]